MNKNVQDLLDFLGQDQDFLETKNILKQTTGVDFSLTNERWLESYIEEKDIDNISSEVIKNYLIYCFILHIIIYKIKDGVAQNKIPTWDQKVKYGDWYYFTISDVFPVEPGEWYSAHTTMAVIRIKPEPSHRARVITTPCKDLNLRIKRLPIDQININYSNVNFDEFPVDLNFETDAAGVLQKTITDYELKKFTLEKIKGMIYGYVEAEDLTY